MATPPSQFIGSSLFRALPQLFANCEEAVRETVSKEFGRKPSTLFLNHHHAVLAYVFLQQIKQRKRFNSFYKPSKYDRKVSA